MRWLPLCYARPSCAGSVSTTAAPLAPPAGVDIFSLAGVLSKGDALGEEALPEAVEEALSQETVPVDVFIAEVRAVLKDATRAQEEEEEAFARLREASAGAGIRRKALEPYRGKLEAKRRTMETAGELLTMAVQMKAEARREGQ